MLDWLCSSYFFSLHHSTFALKAFPCIWWSTLSILICTLSAWHRSSLWYLAFPHPALPVLLWPSQGWVRRASESLVAFRASYVSHLRCWIYSFSSQSDLQQVQSLPYKGSSRLLGPPQLSLYSSIALPDHGMYSWNLSCMFTWPLEVHEVSRFLPAIRKMRGHQTSLLHLGDQSSSTFGSHKPLCKP